MRVTGAKKLQRQLKRMPKETHEALEKSIQRTVKFGERKAKAIVPVDSGHLRDGINSQVEKTDGAILGFINFHDGTKEDAIRTGAINYGRTDGSTSGYKFIETVKLIIGDRHKRAVRRNINKAVRDAMNG